MAIPVIMPRQGQSVESCIITKWHKQKGDKVEIGEHLFTYETDKATFDEDAKEKGTLLAVFFEEGDDVECLLNVCVIGQDGENAEIFNPKNKDEAPKEAVNETTKKEEPAEAKAVSEIKAEAISGDIKISPRARILAEKQHIDVRYATPTGPNGRIIERDIRNINNLSTTAAAAAEFALKDNKVEGTGVGGRVALSDITEKVKAEPVIVQATQPVKVEEDKEFEEVKLPNIRKLIAKSMHASLSTMAQLTLNSSFDATDILSFRNKLKVNKDTMGLENITLNDIVLFAVSRTLPAHKDMNAHYYDDKMVYWKHVNLGVAVDTPRGLIVPTIFAAEKLSLNELSKQAKALIDSAQKGVISPDLIKGGTFTVTNLGGLGVESFTPVINPPQTGILGVNNIETKVKEVNGEYKYYQAMSLSLTFDHRALDGAPAAKFLKDLVKNLENFTMLLVK
jgi:pyruvate dehydrogenase E2 component (dihydrolipoamide acetyltransferase)